jgi:hypothetical protein
VSVGTACSLVDHASVHFPRAGAMSRPRLSASGTRGAGRRPWSFVQTFVCNIDGPPGGRGLNSLSQWHEARRRWHGGGDGRGMMGPGGIQWPEVTGISGGRGKCTIRGRRTALRDTESRMVKDHMRKLTSKGTPGVDGAVAKTAEESTVAQREQQVKGWGKVSLTGGKIGKAKINVDYENEDPDSTSVRVCIFRPIFHFSPLVYECRFPQSTKWCACTAHLQRHHYIPLCITHLFTSFFPAPTNQICLRPMLPGVL